MEVAIILGLYAGLVILVGWINSDMPQERRRILIKREKPIVRPLLPAHQAYNTYNEVNDLCLHMETVGRMIHHRMYKPGDSDWDQFALQLFSLAQQMRTFSKNKKGLAPTEGA